MGTLENFRESCGLLEKTFGNFAELFGNVSQIVLYLLYSFVRTLNDIMYLISIIISLINYVIIVTSDQSDFEKFYILLFPFARYPYLSIIIVR